MIEPQAQPGGGDAPADDAPLHELEGMRPLPFPSLACGLLVLAPVVPCLAMPFVESIQAAMPWEGLRPGWVAAGFALVGVPCSAWLISTWLRHRGWREGRLRVFADRLEWTRYRFAFVGSPRPMGTRRIPIGEIRRYRAGKGFVRLWLDVGAAGLTTQVGVPAPDEDASFALTSWLDERGVSQAS